MLNLCISYSEVIQKLFRIYSEFFHIFSEFFHIFSEFSLMVFFKVVTTFANLRSKNSLFYMLAVEIFLSDLWYFHPFVSELSSTKVGFWSQRKNMHPAVKKMSHQRLLLLKSLRSRNRQRLLQPQCHLLPKRTRSNRVSKTFSRENNFNFL